MLSFSVGFHREAPRKSPSSMTQVGTVIILAAGQGTRMK
ncbi:MAG: hypothetical protein ACI9F9_001534, partial [Candidatus Paceibacteria bacterium]